MTDPVALTAEERGDSLSSRTRAIVRLSTISGLVIAAAVVVIAGISITTAPPSVTSIDTPSVDKLLAEQVTTPTDDAVAEAALVAAEDHRIHDAVQRDLPATDTTLVLGGHRVWTVLDLMARGAVTVVDLHTLRLVRSVVIQSGGTLDFDSPDTAFQLVSGAKGFTSIVGWSANIRMAGAQGQTLDISSWDPATGKVDTDLSDGRAYIRVAGGNLSLTQVKATDLGFWSGRTGGLAATGSVEQPSTADLRDVTTSGLQFGVYLDSVTRATIASSTIGTSLLDGVVVGDGTDNVTITDTTVDASAGTGMKIGSGTTGVTLSGTTISHSGHYGLQYFGKAAAVSANAGGTGVTNGAKFDVHESTFTDNTDGGLVVESTDDVVIDGTTITGPRTGIRISGASDSVQLSKLTITSTEAGGIAVLDGAVNVSIVDSTITGRPAGVVVRNAGATIANSTITTTRTNAAAVLFDGSVATGAVRTTAFNGTGPSAVQQSQAVGRAEVSDVSVAGWTLRPLWLDWIETHPTAFLWILLLLVPAVGIFYIVRNRQRQRRIRVLVEETTLAIARAEKERYDAARRAQFSSPSGLQPRLISSLSVSRIDEEVTAARPAPPTRYAPAPATAPVAQLTMQRPAPPIVREVPRSETPTSTAVSRAIAGRFGSIEDLAVSSVIDGGKSVVSVARTLRVSPKLVQMWVDRALEG